MTALKIRSISPAGVADVFNMEVEDTHDFAIANGVIAHNCYDMVRYVAMENPIAPKAITERAAKQYNPLDDIGYTTNRYDFYKLG